MGKQAAYKNKQAQWAGQQGWGGSSSSWGSDWSQSDPQSWDAEQWKWAKNQAGKNKETVLFPKYSEIRVPTNTQQPAGGLAVDVATDAAGAEQLKEVQRLVNAVRKCDAKLRKNQENTIVRAEQWELFQKQLKASFMEQRAAFLQDNTRSMEEAQQLEQQKAAAAQKLKLIVTGQVVTNQPPHPVEMSQDDAAAWHSLLQEEKTDDMHADNDPWLQDALTAWSRGAAADGGGYQEKLKAWLERHSQCLTATAPSTPTRATTGVLPMTPPGKTLASSRVESGTSVAPLAPTAASPAPQSTPPYMDLLNLGAVADPYQGSPIPTGIPAQEISRVKRTALHPFGTKPCTKNVIVREQGNVGYTRTPVKEINRSSPRTPTPGTGSQARQVQIEAKRMVSTMQIPPNPGGTGTQTIISDDDEMTQSVGGCACLSAME